MTSALTVTLPVVQKSMARLGQPQAEIDEYLGNLALAFEVILALPAIVLLMRNPSLEAALSSALTLLALEVAGKHAYLGYLRLRHEGDRAGLRKALDMLEIRLVYEEVGEKLCILVAPFLAVLPRPARKTAREAGSWSSRPSAFSVWRSWSTRCC